MTPAQVKKTRDWFETNKIPYCIVLDNEHLFWAGATGHRLIWNDETQTCIAIRSNIKPSQPHKPLEIYVIEWEDIQGFKTDVDKKELIAVLAKAGISSEKSEEIVKYYQDLRYFDSQFTTPSGNANQKQDEEHNNKINGASEF